MLLTPDFLTHMVFVFSWVWQCGFIFSYVLFSVLSFVLSSVDPYICTVLSSLFYLFSVLRIRWNLLAANGSIPVLGHHGLLLLKIFNYQFKGVLGEEEIRNMLLWFLQSHLKVKPQFCYFKEKVRRLIEVKWLVWYHTAR